MNPTLASLLDVIERDPLPAAYTSSYWRRFGSETVVERRGKHVVMEGVQIGAVYERHPLLWLLHVLERSSYRALTSSLSHYPAVWRTAQRLARELSFGLTFDVWKSAVITALLQDHWVAHGLAPRTIVVIGDGYGFLSALIRRCRPGARLYCIDLPKSLAFQVHTHETADPNAALSLLAAARRERADVTFVLPQDVQWIEDEIDCAINIASMQEMNLFTIRSYFTFLRQRSTPQSRFYCVNRLQKELPGREVIRFHDYPWQEEDEIFLDGPCPFYTHFFSPMTLPNGPRWLGLRVPFVNAFDGVHLHRLVRLAPQPRDG